MKHFFAIFLVFILLLSTISCSTIDSPETTIVSTEDQTETEQIFSNKTETETIETITETKTEEEQPAEEASPLLEEKPPVTTSKSTPPATTTTQNKNNNANNSDSNRVTVVQMADPETGISWDGKSPIIYTYPDGSTGTEKRVGAIYEQVPGMIDTIDPCLSCGNSVCPGWKDPTCCPNYIPYDGKCKQCGKKEGNGTNGTCVQWLMGAVDCPNCGVHVEVRTCHTCAN